MRLLYEKVYEHICKVDFQTIWNDFHAYPFALYNDEVVYLKSQTIPYEQCFIGNTSIYYEGEQIAIWKVDDYKMEDSELLATNIIHEMFHAYQFEMNESRFPDDLKALDYPIELDNLLLKHTENLTLANALMTKDKKTKLENISSIIALREKRQQIIGEHILYEYSIETVEGTAEYVGLRALYQLDPKKYNTKIESYLMHLKDIKKMLFDTRRMAYFTGSLLLIALWQCDIQMEHDISKEKRTVYEIISKTLPKGELTTTFSKEDILASMQNYLKEKKLLFEDFFKNKPKCNDLGYTICGYDPMNMIKFDDLLWCKSFIMLKTKTKDDPLFIEGPVVVRIDTSNPLRALAFYK